MSNLAVLSSSSSKPIRPIPTRNQVLNIKMHFRGGIIVNCVQFGKMPWWPSALSWCNADTRQQVYNQMRIAGDTHCIVEVPNGLPLYDESDQFYSPDKFPALDWTNNETQLDAQFINLIDEVINEGFFCLIAMDERQDHSSVIVKLVMKSLSDYQLAFCVTMPGYDGVFYGWPPNQISDWAYHARQIKPNCNLVMEFNTAHIPLGNGPVAYLPGGSMQDFDGILGEFLSPPSGTDTTWQILDRCIRPYNRPSDQPISDDHRPPFYLVDSQRGTRVFVAFETDYPYLWVRTNMNDLGATQTAINNIESEGAYLAGCGCTLIS